MNVAHEMYLNRNESRRRKQEKATNSVSQLLLYHKKITFRRTWRRNLQNIFGWQETFYIFMSAENNNIQQYNNNTNNTVQ